MPKPKLTGYAIRMGIGTDHTYVKCDDPKRSYPCWGREEGGRDICSGNADDINIVD